MTGYFWAALGEEERHAGWRGAVDNTSCAAPTALPAAMPYHGGLSQGWVKGDGDAIAGCSNADRGA